MKHCITGICASACLMSICSLQAFDFLQINRPAEILLDGSAAGSRVTLKSTGELMINGGSASTLRLRWPIALRPDVRVIGSMWERTYGDTSWRNVGDEKPVRGGALPWYVLLTDGTRTDGYGVKVQPNAFACWKVSTNRLELILDVRAGSLPVALGNRSLGVCELVSRQGRPNETAFSSGREFCRLMCPRARLPKQPVYGYNDWYCAYGRNTATNFLADAKRLIDLMDAQPGVKIANRPFVVVDDGWQLKEALGDVVGVEGQWVTNNVRWGMDMATFCRRVKAMGGRPGVWYRPLMPWKAMPDSWKTRGRAEKIWHGDFSVDPTRPEVAAAIRRDLQRFRKWGVELVKIDFITYDWNTRWGYDLSETPLAHDKAVWGDTSRTTAEAVRSLYAAMRDGAGDEMIIIGCNAIDHFAAGLFELQRTGDDTDGRGWTRTRRMGPNTLGMRAIHNGIFYQNDGDCVGLVNEGDVDWSLNRQWLDLVAESGTALFTSWKRENTADPAVANALGAAWRRAATPKSTAEPVDWLETPRPRRWQLSDGRVKTYDWDVWPLIVVRHTGRINLMPKVFDATLAIHRKYPGSCDEFWFCDTHNPSTFEAEKKNLLAYKSRCEESGILFGYQQGITLGHAPVDMRSDRWAKFPEETWQCNSKGGRMGFFCPRSASTARYESDNAATFAKLGFASYWLDDDLRLGICKSDGCFCPKCIEAFNRFAGETVTREELVNRLYGPAERDMIREKWCRFNGESLAAFGAAAREGVARVNPNCRMAYQSVWSDTIYTGRDLSALLKALSGADRRPVGIRPGACCYTDAQPRDFIGKALSVAREAERCRRLGGIVGTVCYEQETFPRRVLHKSPAAIVTECTLAMASGCDSLSLYWWVGGNPEPLEDYERFAAAISKARPDFEKLSAIVKRTSLGGVARFVGSAAGALKGFDLRDPMDRNLALAGIPVTVAEADPAVWYLSPKSFAESTDADFDRLSASKAVVPAKVFRAFAKSHPAEASRLVADPAALLARYDAAYAQALLDVQGVIRPYPSIMDVPREAMKTGAVVARAKRGGAIALVPDFDEYPLALQRRAWLDALDALSPMSVRTDLCHALRILPRVDKAGRVLSVTLLNCSIGETGDFDLEVRNPAKRLRVKSIAPWSIVTLYP